METISSPFGNVEPIINNDNLCLVNQTIRGNHVKELRIDSNLKLVIGLHENNPGTGYCTGMWILNGRPLMDKPDDGPQGDNLKFALDLSKIRPYIPNEFYKKD